MKPLKKLNRPIPKPLLTHFTFYLTLVLIFSLPTTQANTREAKAAKVDYDEWNFFGMFNYKKCGFKKGIVKQSIWARDRVKYLNSLPKQMGLFADEVVIDDKCNSGYCGV